MPRSARPEFGTSVLSFRDPECPPGATTAQLGQRTRSISGVDEGDVTDSGPAEGWESRRVRRVAARAAGASGEIRTGSWRTPLWYRIVFPAIGLYFLYATVDFFDGGTDLGFTALSAVLGLAFTVGPFVPVVRLEEHTVYARGLVFHRVLALRDIVDVRPGYSGLSIETEDGSVFEATGVGEKWNIARWMGRRTAADSVADLILDAAAVAQQGQGPDAGTQAADSAPAVSRHRSRSASSDFKNHGRGLVWLNRVVQAISSLAVGGFLIQTVRGVDMPTWVVLLVGLSVLVSVGTQLLVMRASSSTQEAESSA